MSNGKDFMPRLGGYDTASAMALFQSPPVLVAVTADNLEASREQTRLGFMAHLVNPWNRNVSRGCAASRKAEVGSAPPTR